MLARGRKSSPTGEVWASGDSNALIHRPCFTQEAPAHCLLGQQQCNFGEVVKLVGSLPETGDGDAANAPLMHWTEGHVWVLDMQLAPGTTLDYSFARQSGAGVTWEAKGKRTLRLPRRMLENGQEELGGVATAEVTCKWEDPEGTVVHYSVRHVGSGSTDEADAPGQAPVARAAAPAAPSTYAAPKQVKPLSERGSRFRQRRDSEGGAGAVPDDDDRRRNDRAADRMDFDQVQPMNPAMGSLMPEAKPLKFRFKRLSTGEVTTTLSSGSIDDSMDEEVQKALAASAARRRQQPAASSESPAVPPVDEAAAAAAQQKAAEAAQKKAEAAAQKAAEAEAIAAATRKLELSWSLGPRGPEDPMQAPPKEGSQQPPPNQDQPAYMGAEVAGPTKPSTTDPTAPVSTSDVPTDYVVTTEVTVTELAPAPVQAESVPTTAASASATAASDAETAAAAPSASAGATPSASAASAPPAAPATPAASSPPAAATNTAGAGGQAPAAGTSGSDAQPPAGGLDGGLLGGLMGMFRKSPPSAKPPQISWEAAIASQAPANMDLPIEIKAAAGGEAKATAEVAASLNRLLFSSQETITGQGLRDMMLKKWDRSYDVQLLRKGQRMSFQVMWKHLEQQTFPLTEDEYMNKLNAIADCLSGWGVVDTVRQGIANARSPPGMSSGGVARTVSIPLGVDLDGGRSREWSRQ